MTYRSWGRTRRPLPRIADFPCRRQLAEARAYRRCSRRWHRGRYRLFGKVRRYSIPWRFFAASIIWSNVLSDLPLASPASRAESSSSRERTVLGQASRGSATIFGLISGSLILQIYHIPIENQSHHTSLLHSAISASLPVSFLFATLKHVSDSVSVVILSC